MVPQSCILAHFEATFNSFEVNLLAHNDLWLSYYGQVNSLRLKSSIVSKWANEQL